MADSSGRTTWIGRWLFILIILGAMHILMDVRFRIAGLFPSDAAGFAILGILYLVLSIILTRSRPSALFHRLDGWTRSKLSWPVMGGNRILLISVLLLMTLCSCIARWYFMERVPIDTQFADMLPLIQQACNAFLEGMNPYRLIYEMPWKLPLTFWPGMWMPYLPLQWMGADLRWLHLVVVIVIAAVLGTITLRSACDRVGEKRATLMASFAAFFLFLFSTEPIRFAGIGHTPPQWAWVAFFSVALLSRRHFLTAISLGLLLASRQTAVVLAPFVVLYWIRSTNSLLATIKFTSVVCSRRSKFTRLPEQSLQLLAGAKFTDSGTTFPLNS